MSILLKNGSILTNEELFAIPADGSGWRVLPDDNRASIGNWASIGDWASIGNWASIGDWASIGNWASIGDGASIGNWARIGDGSRIGNRASIGDWGSIGNWASIGDGAKFEHSPLAVQGTRHLAINYSAGHISIGCEIHSYAEWQQQYREIGTQHGYTAAQIEEYGKIIDFIAANGLQIEGAE